MDIPHIQDVPRIEDDRGWLEPWFLESEHHNFTAKQINFNMTKKNAFRGFHFGIGGNAQAKYISCIEGKVVDFVLDLRSKTKEFGKVYRFELSGEHSSVVCIPPGFAHGIYGVAEESLMVYASSQEWNPVNEFTISPLDPALNLEIDLGTLMCTERDRKGMYIKDFANYLEKSQPQTLE